MNRRTASRVKALIIALLPILFFQCEKEEPNNSALINCTISLFSNAAMQGKITINQAFANIQQIDINGTTPSLNVVTFSRAVSENESTLSLLDNTNNNVPVDAERNDYDPLVLTLTLRNDSHPLQVISSDTGTDANVDEYLQNAKPALFMGARFDNRGRSIPVYVVFPEVNPLRTVGDQYGSARVKVDLENVAETQINPAYIFDALTTTQVEGATRAMYQNQEVIFIHPSFNSELHAMMLARLEDATNSVRVRLRVTRSADD